jgi:hypothetical protein
MRDCFLCAMRCAFSRTDADAVRGKSTALAFDDKLSLPSHATRMCDYHHVALHPHHAAIDRTIQRRLRRAAQRCGSPRTLGNVLESTAAQSEFAPASTRGTAPRNSTRCKQRVGYPVGTLTKKRDQRDTYRQSESERFESRVVRPSKVKDS